jgi:hypothetical protein
MLYPSTLLLLNIFGFFVLIAPACGETANSAPPAPIPDKLSIYAPLTKLSDINKNIFVRIEILKDETNKMRQIEELRYLRQNVSFALSAAKALLAEIDRDLLSDQNSIAAIDAKLEQTSYSPQHHSAIRDKLILIIDHAKKEIAESQKKIPQLEGDWAFQAGLEITVRNRSIELEELNARAEELPQLRKKREELTNKYDALLGVKGNLTSEIRNGEDAFGNIEDLAARALSVAVADQSYTLNSTIVFGLLVGAVIGGFFWIAIISPNVREQIFVGQFGIQFVTLFSLIIAIILFGVLKILEGRELAALLGGLSGYILGRSSNGSFSGPPRPVDSAQTNG